MFDSDLFREMYGLYYPDVYRFALFLSGDASRAEDLAAETFVRAWMASGRIRQESIRAYLLTITRNLYRDHQRSIRRLVALDEVRDTAEAAPSTEALIQQRHRLHEARAQLRRLAAGDRRALLLYVVREMSYAEIAEKLGISINATKSRIFRARAALLTSLADRRGGTS